MKNTDIRHGFFTFFKKAGVLLYGPEPGPSPTFSGPARPEPEVQSPARPEPDKTPARYVPSLHTHFAVYGCAGANDPLIYFPGVSYCHCQHLSTGGILHLNIHDRAQEPAGKRKK